MSSYEEAKEKRIAVWNQVREDFGRHTRIQSQVYTEVNPTEYEAFPKLHATTEVIFLQKDCVYAAIDAIRMGRKPLLLNMASDFTPGGGVAKGSSAQEEDLFRRSDYHRHLQLHRKDYPLTGTKSILSKQVLFYRLSETYELMQTPTRIDCIAAAAIRKPITKAGGKAFATVADRDLFRSKVRMLFYAALKNGNDTLILSAWGCGAFGCPIEEVAHLFREVAEENLGRIRTIVFAIHDTRTFQQFKMAYEA